MGVSEQPSGEDKVDSVDFDALEAQARAKMSPAAFAFCAAGADDEISAVENISAWRALRLRPRVLNDVSSIDTRVTLLGSPVPVPILVPPMGRHKLFHAEGERAAAGFTALVLTVDAPVGGWSPRAAREQYEPSPDILSINMPGTPTARTFYHPDFAGKVLYPATWRELEWLVKRSAMPVIIKGVLRGDDALRCVDCGARAIMVSNHGGRHLDTTVTTAAALGDVAAAVGTKAEVYVDGGIRRGTDIFKALALGARAVMIGRPVLWGLAVHGSNGVRDVLEHLRVELVRAMQLCGTATLADIKPDFLAARPSP